MSISGQIVSEILAQLYLENSIQILLNFFWVDLQKKFRRVCMEFSKDNLVKEQYSLRGDQNDFLIKTYPNDACKMSVR